MKNIHSFRDLQVWQRAMDLVEDIYKVTKLFPRDERFGLRLITSLQPAEEDENR